MTINPSALFGRPTPRIDGAAKVTGTARYASDEPVANPAYASLVTSTIARGRLAELKLDRAKAVPGVLDILTHENVGAQAKRPPSPDGQPTTTTLESDQIWHDGQIVAVVVAETFEAAREAANRVEVTYVEERPSASFDTQGLASPPIVPETGSLPRKGDADVAFKNAAVRVDARYRTPAQHHNAMELFTTTCAWDGSRLTIYEPTQGMWGTKAAVSTQLGLAPEHVRVVSRYVGGAFGGKAAITSRTAWIAIAARRLGRPIKLVATRDQGFTIATFRAETRQHVKLGASRDGRLVSLFHEGWEITSRPSDYGVAGVNGTARMYASPNIGTAAAVIHADRNTPGFMRGPTETPYMFSRERDGRAGVCLGHGPGRVAPHQ